MSLSVRSFLEANHFKSIKEAEVALGITRPSDVKSILKGLEPASALQFRLHVFREIQSTDSGAQGGSDEVFLSAIASDSSSIVVGPDRKPQAELMYSPRIGDISDDAVRNPWKTNPLVLFQFDMKKPGDWPRSYSVTLLLVEEDNTDLADSFKELESAVGGTIKKAAVAAASTATGALAGAAIGSVIPGIGTAVGAAVGALAATVYDDLIGEIAKGLGNEVFKPIPVILKIDEQWPAALQKSNEINRIRTLRIEEHGATYEIDYDWHLVK
jgi:hypothetical protein